MIVTSGGRGDRPSRWLPLAAKVALTGMLFIGSTACGMTPQPGPSDPPARTPVATLGTSTEPTVVQPSSTGAAGSTWSASSAQRSNSALPRSTTGLVLPPSPPVSLSVPAIGISSELIQLGLNPDGSVEVPSLDDPDSRPGWYRDSPTPGAVGPAIILGHVDSRRFGPGALPPSRPACRRHRRGHPGRRHRRGLLHRRGSHRPEERLPDPQVSAT